MSDALSFEERLASEYGGLSTKLKAAADYAVANQVDMATRSLRKISTASGLAPATFSRLARAMGFEDYEALRETMRGTVERRVNQFSEKAVKLQDEAKTDRLPPFLQRQSQACVANINALETQIDPVRLEVAVKHLHEARQVLLVGALGSTGVVEYLFYLAQYFTPNWLIAGRMGASLGAVMTNLGAKDAILIITKPPFATYAIRAAEMAAKQGAYVIVITDSHTCPALTYAHSSFIVPTDSPQFFSSYAATLVLCETIIGMLVARAGPAAQQRISEVQARNRNLNEIWDG